MLLGGGGMGRLAIAACDVPSIESCVCVGVWVCGCVGGWVGVGRWVGCLGVGVVVGMNLHVCVHVRQSTKHNVRTCCLWASISTIHGTMSSASVST
jgi:hypothetical protein